MHNICNICNLFNQFSLFIFHINHISIWLMKMGIFFFLLLLFFFGGGTWLFSLCCCCNIIFQNATVQLFKLNYSYFLCFCGGPSVKITTSSTAQSTGKTREETQFEFIASLSLLHVRQVSPFSVSSLTDDMSVCTIYWYVYSKYREDVFFFSDFWQ